MDQSTRKKKVVFLPFSYFCELIKRIADTKNDPSFSYGDCNPSSSPTRPSYTRKSHRDYRGPVSVKTTDILLSPATIHKKNDQNMKIENPNHQCPINNKPHPPKKCIGFRKKLLEECKELLNKFGVCYKCCASTLCKGL